LEPAEYLGIGVVEVCFEDGDVVVDEAVGWWWSSVWWSSVWWGASP